METWVRPWADYELLAESASEIDITSTLIGGRTVLHTADLCSPMADKKMPPKTGARGQTSAHGG